MSEFLEVEDHLLLQPVGRSTSTASFERLSETRCGRRARSTEGGRHDEHRAVRELVISASSAKILPGAREVPGKIAADHFVFEIFYLYLCSTSKTNHIHGHSGGRGHRKCDFNGSGLSRDLALTKDFDDVSMRSANCSTFPTTTRSSILGAVQVPPATPRHGYEAGVCHQGGERYGEREGLVHEHIPASAIARLCGTK